MEQYQRSTAADPMDGQTGTAVTCDHISFHRLSMPLRKPGGKTI